MPKYKDEEGGAIVQHNAGHFGFSAVNVGTLVENDYTLATIAVDVSGSVMSFRDQLEEVLNKIVESLRGTAKRPNPRADNVLLRVVTFGRTVQELHPWEKVVDIPPDRYTGAIQIGGDTPLNDGTLNVVEAVSNFGHVLLQQDYSVNGIVFVITDGDENASKFKDPKHVRKALEETITGENLESCLSFLIGVNMSSPHMAQRLDEYHTEVGFTHFIPLTDASADTLGKLQGFVSDSISSQSQALGTGGPSQQIDTSVVF